MTTAAHDPERAGRDPARARAAPTDPTDLDAAVARRRLRRACGARSATSGRPARSPTIAASGLRGRGGAGFPTGDKWRTAATHRRPPRALRRRQRLRRGPGVRDRPVPAGARPVRGHRGRRPSPPSRSARARRSSPSAPRTTDADPPRSRPPSARPRTAGFIGVRRRSAPGRDLDGHRPAGPGRLHARRGDRPAQGPRGQARPARAAAAASRRARPVRACRRSSRTSRPSPRVPWILANGAGGVRRDRRRRQPRDGPRPGPRRRRATGIAEVPLGTPLREIVALGGGAPGRPVDQGGPRRRPVGRAAAARARSTRRTTSTPLRAAGAHVGSGSVVVADDRACIVDLARLLTRFCADEACGKTIPCRIGTRRLVEIGDRVVDGPAATHRPGPPGRPLGRHRRRPRCATTSAWRPSRSRAGCDTSGPSSTTTSCAAPARPASATRSRWPPARPA